jgi:hypothetical protein
LEFETKEALTHELQTVLQSVGLTNWDPRQHIPRGEREEPGNATGG